MMGAAGHRVALLRPCLGAALRRAVGTTTAAAAAAATVARKGAIGYKACGLASWERRGRHGKQTRRRGAGAGIVCIGLGAAGLATQATEPGGRGPATAEPTPSCPFADATDEDAGDDVAAADAEPAIAARVLAALDPERDHWVFERVAAGEQLEPATIDRMVEYARGLPGLRVVLFGEEHDDRVAHRLQLGMLTALATSDQACALSMEMLETDQAAEVEQFVAGEITALELLRWSNAADYAPLITFARSAGCDIVPANPPREYVSRVSKQGAGSLAALPEDERALLPPLPLAPMSGIMRSKLKNFFSTLSHDPSPESASRLDRLCEAQNLWDATMAHNVARAAAADPACRVFHVCGRFHCEHFLGINEHLRRHDLGGGGGGGGEVVAADKPVLNVVCIQLDSFDEMESAAADPLIKHSADFVVFTLGQAPQQLHEEEPVSTPDVSGGK